MIPWKIFVILGSFAFFVAFAALNVRNESDVSFGFYVFRNVPVFFSLFFAFLAGTVFIIPFFIRKKMKKSDIFPNRKKPTAKEKIQADDE